MAGGGTAPRGGADPSTSTAVVHLASSPHLVRAHHLPAAVLSPLRPCRLLHSTARPSFHYAAVPRLRRRLRSSQPGAVHPHSAPVSGYQFSRLSGCAPVAQSLRVAEMALPAEQKISFSIIIDSILKGSDLTSISAKQVRNKLAERLGYDITSQKEAINALIGQRFDAISNQATEPAAEHRPTNGVVKSIERPSSPVSPPPAKKKKYDSSPKRHAYSEDESDMSDVRDSPKPKKKRKQTTVEEDDAAFAARLQDEENRLARPTRGGSSRKRTTAKPAQKKKKKKSAARVKDDDDSSRDSSSEAEPKERKGGFHKPMVLSQPLAELLGETTLSRPQTVKKIWEYVRARDLQDPSDKRQIRCDEPMRRVFKSDRVHMFTMNKILNQNLYAQDE